MNAPHDLNAWPILKPRPVPAPMLEALKARFGDRCSTARAVREQHGRDESPFDVPPPDAVVDAVLAPPPPPAAYQLGVPVIAD